MGSEGGHGLSTWAGRWDGQWVAGRGNRCGLGLGGQPCCRGHICAGPCSRRRSGLQAPPHRRAGVPGAGSGRAGRPVGGRHCVTVPPPGICPGPPPGTQESLLLLPLLSGALFAALEVMGGWAPAQMPITQRPRQAPKKPMPPTCVCTPHHHHVTFGTQLPPAPPCGQAGVPGGSPASHSRRPPPAGPCCIAAARSSGGPPQP